MRRARHTAWTPPSLPDSIVLLGGNTNAVKLTAEIVPGISLSKCKLPIPIPGGATFSLRHSGDLACGIPDGETLILTGGAGHNFVTRWEHEHRNSFSYGHEDADNDNPHIL